MIEAPEKMDTLTPASPSEPPKNSFRWSELIQVVLLTLAIVIPVRLFLANPFKVDGASMEPTYYDKEYLVVDELSYHFQMPQRGEVVVFHPPSDPSKYFIKRVIGLPGETIELMNGVVKIYNQQYQTGWTLDERSYLDLSDYSKEEMQAMTMRPLTLGPDEYFLMGDNRRASYDSRYFGGVKRSALVGRAWLRGFPIQRWGVLTNLPNYPMPATTTTL